MEDTINIARAAGAYLVVTGLGFVISTNFYARMTRSGGQSDPVLINLSGAAHFVVGAILLMQHFRWGTAPEIVVSLVGCAAVLKGAALIVMPETALKSPPQGPWAIRMSAVGFLAVGGYLLFVGFCV